MRLLLYSSASARNWRNPYFWHALDYAIYQLNGVADRANHTIDGNHLQPRRNDRRIRCHNAALSFGFDVFFDVRFHDAVNRKIRLCRRSHHQFFLALESIIGPKQSPATSGRVHRRRLEIDQQHKEGDH